MRNVLSSVCFCFLFSISINTAVAQDDAEQEALARRLLNSQGCRACHAFEGGQAKLGPDLIKISKGLNQTELAQSLANPEHLHGGGLIPDFSHLRAEELDALVTFLHGLLPEGKKTMPNLRTAPDAQSAQPDISKP